MSRKDWAVAAAWAVLVAWTGSAHATLIEETVTFETQQTQSMWSSGNAGGSILVEQFLGARWGTYSDPTTFLNLFNIPPVADHYTLGGFVGGQTNNACIGAETSLGCVGFRTDINTTTGVEVQLTTSGRIGVFAGAELSAGGIDVTLPVDAMITLPDQVVAGQYFDVSTSSQTLSTGASITATAPTFRAFVDGVFDTENTIYGKGCIVGQCADDTLNIDVNLGRFNILEVDTSQENPWSIFGYEVPGLPVLELTKRAASPLDPDGIDQTPGGPNFNPILVQAEARGLTDAEGGTVSDNKLVLNASSEILSIDVELLGIVESLFPIVPGVGILSNRYDFVDTEPLPTVSVAYDIASVSVGPVLKVNQSFNLDPKPAVRLQFDTPVTALEMVQVGTRQVKVGESCSFVVFCTDIFETQPVFGLRDVVHSDGVVEVLLGDTAHLKFDQGVGQLVERTYFLQDSTFNTTTALGLDFNALAKFGCVDITGLGEGCLVSGQIQKEIGALNVSSRQFALQGFNEVSFADLYRFNDDVAGGGSDGTVSVPEPGTFLLLLSGLLGLGLMGSFKRPECLHRAECSG